MPELPLIDGLFLSSVERSDRDALVEHLQDREIWRNTLRIPYPYTEEVLDAEDSD